MEVAEKILWNVHVEVENAMIGISLSKAQSLQCKFQTLPTQDKPYQPGSTTQITSEPTKSTSVPKVLYLIELPEPNYQLIRPLAVFVEQEEKGWIAFREDIGIYSYGTTIDEAIANFAISLLDDYDIYTLAKPEELSEGGSQLANWLRETVKRA